MSLFILDTDIFTLWRESHATVTLRIIANTLQGHDIAISIISAEEQISGWYSVLRKARTPDQVVRAYRHLSDVLRALAPLQIISFSAPAIVRHSQIVRMRLNVGKNDLRIAAIALEAGGTVVTRNLRDFQRVPGLSCMDWSV